MRQFLNEFSGHFTKISRAIKNRMDIKPGYFLRRKNARMLINVIGATSKMANNAISIVQNSIQENSD
jgi:hypothetical protein